MGNSVVNSVVDSAEAKGMTTVKPSHKVGESRKECMSSKFGAQPVQNE